MTWHYDVQKSDCLSVIAAKHGETTAQIEADNPQFSANWDLIYPGQDVIMDGRASSGRPPSGGPISNKRSGPTHRKFEPTHDVTVTVNEHPLRHVRNLLTERVDEGQDFGGSGPIYAVGRGVITNVWGAGWPGGVYILEKITHGAGAGKYIYFAENIAPTVIVGQHVNHHTVIGHMNGGIEIGWGTSTPQQTLAIATTGYSEGQATPAGRDMQKFLRKLRHSKHHHQAIHHFSTLKHKRHHHRHHHRTVDGVFNAATIYNFLRNHGFTRNAAAGILGNIGQESAGSPNSVGSGGCGLIGWTPCSVPVGDLWAQMDDIVKYVRTYGSIADINAHSVTPTEAADWFMTNYERCNPAYCNAGNRESIAWAIAHAG